MSQKLIFTTVLLALLLPAALSAQESIVTDRPDAAESSLTVPAGRVQIETGVDASFDSTTRTFLFPTKFRVGLLDDLELHLESDVGGVTTVEVAGATETRSGASSVDAGGKYHILDGGGGVPSLGLLGALTIPTGGEFSPDYLSVTALVAADWDLTDHLGLGTNLGAAIPFSDAAPVAGLYAIALGIGLPPHPPLGFFVEVFGSVDSDGATLATDGGLTYLITPDFQLDAYVRTGLINLDETVGFGAGLSFRL